MKKIFFLYILIIISCSPSKEQKPEKFRGNFSMQENTLMQEARKIIKNAYFAEYISIDSMGYPKTRVIEPFSPTQQWKIYFGTNPRSRKVKEIMKNPKTAMHYFDKTQLAYVSLYGKSHIIRDSLLRQRYWKPAWEAFYPDKEKDYLLIEFIPEFMEIINISKGFTGDSLTWKPHRIELRY